MDDDLRKNVVRAKQEKKKKKRSHYTSVFERKS